jgi:hypothetical protein
VQGCSFRKSLTGCLPVPGNPVDNGTRPLPSLAPVTHVRLSDSTYTPVFKTALQFLFSIAGPTLYSPSHFFISVHLSFPNWKPINTYALVDSGATTLCISKCFTMRHSLPRCLKDVPVPIMVVDDHPIVSGLITHDILTNISVGAHSELQPLAIVAVGYPIILGLDWLCHHNPKIDWAEANLSLNCCGLSCSYLVTVVARGFGLRPQLS